LIDVQGGGGAFFILYILHHMLFTGIEGEGTLFVLGVMNLHPTSSGPDMLLLILNALFTSILYYFLQD